MQTTQKRKFGLLQILVFPAHILSVLIHKVVPHNPRHSKLGIGLVITFLGAYTAHHLPDFMHSIEWAWDGFGYTIHAIGAAPIIEELSVVNVIIKKFDATEQD